MAKEKQAGNQMEETRYYGEIPKEVMGDMTPDIRVQYFYWDEVLKRQIQVHPEMFPPLVKETFGKEYPAGTPIKVLSTEYVTVKAYVGGKRIESIRSDLMVQIGSKDIYHMECQMKQGGDIAVRMLEYDVNAALVHGLERVENNRKGNKYMVRFPKSAILYLDSTERTPSKEGCIIVFPDGTEYEYSIPVLKVQSYTPEMMGEKGLHILIPFSPIRFRRRLDAILKKKDFATSQEVHEKMEILKKDLTNHILNCIMIVNREEENETLKGRAATDIVEYLGRTCDHLFSKEPELLKEVHGVMEPVIKLAREEAEDTIKLIREETEDTIKLIKKEIEHARADVERAREDAERAREDAEHAREDAERTREEAQGYIKNYIRQCKEEGKSKEQTEQALESIFSLTLTEAEVKIEKWW